MDKQNIGVIGLGVMGANLALNIHDNGYTVSVYDYWTDRVDELVGNNENTGNISGAYSAEEFVSSLEKPRKILMMVKAGETTDKVIESLVPHLEEGDMLIDGGNTYYEDTERRGKYLEEKGIHFIGTGFSGGEEGARKGPSIMPGGPSEAYAEVKPIFDAIAANVEGTACAAYMGRGGAGHYVKMVHNGIEYGDMQLICEAYFIMKNILGLSAQELHEVFKEWNEGELDSYLIEITADIFTKVDEETGKPLVEVILDTAGQKGTGKWTSKSALDLGVPLPIITESVFSRFISAMKEERQKASQYLTGPEITFNGSKEEVIESLRKALYMSKICSYAQGFAQMRAQSEEKGWDLQYGDIAMNFRGGCIIRAQFLQKIKDAYDKDESLTNLLLDPYFQDIATSYQKELRETLALAIQHGVPVPAFSSALAYYDSYRTAKLPANLLQAQRDYFGAHTYQRVDKEGTFHTDWING
ncbi:NADP-dependent phosphogluconate dehydrogenase [Halobacillus karajensis]|uniref:6-phosphogluconate dehydrogenase, decarboxylating n=1 Tax=Halobacillus karajensis TaxID=195088 RepID=A0A024P3G0_9BACI|nr:NADP-dependent phosphogluconate dehydrogenase [Halobacillus karajensis]CDQ19134.1 6-phosphogluconate dehydrogenase, NADP(+)-dependent, decarboxylating [Halobacillus karajensis]CDQ22792.1 6-phosphogluconate dehydrogenase, NADP(+)-dependent, decarboxylating [Halobacillus karajensis]CDQ26274.1 6-phosphogluconate dehydrogenase, NADP(+)-dependent, decarboxylating [Halobacillus karajensis]